MYEQAIAIWEQVHGKFHPLVATGYNNLGLLLKADVSVPETNLDWENLFLVCTAPRRRGGSRVHFCPFPTFSESENIPRLLFHGYPGSSSYAHRVI